MSLLKVIVFIFEWLVDVGASLRLQKYKAIIINSGLYYQNQL